MRTFQVVVGPCLICSKPASFEIGSIACQSCGKVFNKICERCATEPCPQCKGHLEATERVFPHSLFKAIAKGDDRDVERLIRNRSEPLEALKNREGETALALAARFKAAPIAKSMCEKLIGAGASPHAKSHQTGRTALMTMVHNRTFHKDVAELLMSSINDQDGDGRTALMLAAIGAGLFGSRRGNVAIAQTLLELGADPLICDKRGFTALGHAIALNRNDKNDDMVTFLKEAMLIRAARREFEARNSYHFDELGNLQVAPHQR
jgi:Ankyrin repeats (3 copies)